MRELTVVGFDVDGKHIICESKQSAERFLVRADDRLRAAFRGEPDRNQPREVDDEVTNVLTPKEIQSRIRAGASVEQVAEASGADITRVERFAHPVLLERSRAAELATASHPVLADGPAVATLLETIAAALVARGLDHDTASWDAWRNADGRWTAQLTWQAGLSENAAHFRFTPGAHGGTATPLDDAASELIDPNFERPPLRPVAQVPQLPQLDFDEPQADQPPSEEPRTPPKTRRRRPPVPAWEDVLLDVRSGGRH
jgi:hypothetical protein